MQVTIVLVYCLKSSLSDKRNLRLKFSIKNHSELLLLILQWAFLQGSFLPVGDKYKL